MTACLAYLFIFLSICLKLEEAFVQIFKKNLTVALKNTPTVKSVKKHVW